MPWIPVPDYIPRDIASLIEEVAWGSKPRGQPTVSEWQDAIQAEQCVTYRKHAALMKASSNGHLAIFEWLVGRETYEPCEFERAVCVACRNGHTNIIDHVVDNDIYTPDVCVYLDLCKAGLAKMVAYIYHTFIPDDERTERLKVRAYARALGCGNLEVTNWINSIPGSSDSGYTYCYNKAMVYAARGGHLRTAKRLKKLGANNYRSAFRESLIYGHVPVAEWLLEVYPPLRHCIRKSLGSHHVCKHGTPQMMKWLTSNGYIMEVNCLATACTYGNLDLVIWIHAEIMIRVTQTMINDAFVCACKNNHWHIAHWAVANGGANNLYDGIVLAFHKNFEFSRWLIQQGAPGIDMVLAFACRAKKDLATIKWCLARGGNMEQAKVVDITIGVWRYAPMHHYLM